MKALARLFLVLNVSVASASVFAQPPLVSCPRWLSTGGEPVLTAYEALVGSPTVSTSLLQTLLDSPSPLLLASPRSSEEAHLAEALRSVAEVCDPALFERLRGVLRSLLGDREAQTRAHAKAKREIDGTVLVPHAEVISPSRVSQIFLSEQGADVFLLSSADALLYRWTPGTDLDRKVALGTRGEPYVGTLFPGAGRIIVTGEVRFKVFHEDLTQSGDFEGVSRARSLVVSPQGKQVAFVRPGGTEVWSANRMGTIGEKPTFKVADSRLERFTPRGNHLVRRTANFHELEFLALDGSDQRRTIEYEKPASASPFVSSLSFDLNVDGNRAALALNDVAAIQIWDWMEGRKIQELNGAPDHQGYSSVTFSPDGLYVVAATRGLPTQNLVVWDAVSGELLESVRVFDENIEALAFSLDSKKLIMAAKGVSNLGVVRIFRFQPSGKVSP